MSPVCVKQRALAYKVGYSSILCHIKVRTDLSRVKFANRLLKSDPAIVIFCNPPSSYVEIGG